MFRLELISESMDEVGLTSVLCRVPQLVASPAIENAASSVDIARSSSSDVLIVLLQLLHLADSCPGWIVADTLMLDADMKLRVSSLVGFDRCTVIRSK